MEIISPNKPKTKAIFNYEKMEKERKLILRPFLYRLTMLHFLPLGFLTGLKVTRLDDVGCDVKVPYKYLNMNPFKTTYWAVLGMAAEMASGIILLNYTKHVKPSVATYVVGCESKFLNRALNVVTFTCNEAPLILEKVRIASETGEAQIFKTFTNGMSKDGKLIAEFIFTWSIKGRNK